MGDFIFRSHSQGWIARHSQAMVNVFRIVGWPVFSLLKQAIANNIYIYTKHYTISSLRKRYKLSHSRCETEGCGTSFQTPSALRKHQKTHRGRATDLASAIKNDILGGVTLSRDPFTVSLTEYLWQLDISDICTQFGWVHGVEPNKNSRTSKFSGHV